MDAKIIRGMIFTILEKDDLAKKIQETNGIQHITEIDMLSILMEEYLYAVTSNTEQEAREDIEIAQLDNDDPAVQMFGKIMMGVSIAKMLELDTEETQRGRFSVN